VNKSSSRELAALQASGIVALRGPRPRAMRCPRLRTTSVRARSDGAHGTSGAAGPGAATRTGPERMRRKREIVREAWAHRVGCPCSYVRPTRSDTLWSARNGVINHPKLASGPNYIEQAAKLTGHARRIHPPIVGLKLRRLDVVIHQRGERKH
jgi:hypothetical protein